MRNSAKYERFHQQAREAFSKHVIRKSDEKGGRWLLQRRHADGNGWDSTYWVEVVSLEGGALYVGGDIDFVIFSYYSDKPGDHRAKVHWMCHSDFGYYVHQKAAIGTGLQLIDVWDGDSAKETVEQWIEDVCDDESADQQVASNLREVLAEDFLDWDDQNAVIDALVHKVGYDWLCDVHHFGMIIHPRVHFAYAAVKRLAAIWDEQDKAVADATAWYTQP